MNLLSIRENGLRWVRSSYIKAVNNNYRPKKILSWLIGSRVMRSGRPSSQMPTRQNKTKTKKIRTMNLALPVSTRLRTTTPGSQSVGRATG